MCQCTHPDSTGTVYGIQYRQSIYSLRFISRWLIRLSYFWTDWGSDYSCHESGVYKDEEEANRVAAQMQKEFGGLWTVKPLPWNAVLPPQPAKIAPTSYYGMSPLAAELYKLDETRPSILIAKPLGQIQKEERDLARVVEQARDLVWDKPR